MKRQIKLFMVMLILLSLVGCASETPWRKATVTTYELLGMGIGAGKDTAESLKAQNLITDQQLLAIKNAYNKSREAFVAAGNTLKLAGQVQSAISRDSLLVEYDKLLMDFRTLSYQLYELLKNVKKVSYLEVLEAVMIGGEV